MPGLFTQARRLDLIEAEVVDAAEALGVSVDGVDVVPLVEGVSPAAVRVVQDGIAEMERMQESVAVKSRSLVAELREAGLSVRDVGTVMKVSPQRVSQLSQPRKAKRAAGSPRVARTARK
ncbi:XRE family transcriptional regulator [Tsukamurella conjunctivitidis]|uniref:XRE family transcriptional regulator n=1 Tax=Tsukamurella conjunctivitidis TaxID=2592068 RepID=A0A5C5RRC6_9ACTN|nr:XRE family transcriptional regulator [Tsukamurella conjunctivitidis]TWS25606.1 XRE family transcriptional regulator [Tsukamurella conjunctivitidis]